MGKTYSADLEIIKGEIFPDWSSKDFLHNMKMFNLMLKFFIKQNENERKESILIHET